RLHRFFLHQFSLESKLNGRQKVKGGNGSSHCLNLDLTHCLSHCLAHCLAHHPESRSGLCRVAGRFSDSETSWVLAGGAEGSFLCSLSSRFSGRGAGWEAPPGRGGELGCQAQQVLKKFVRLASVFPSPPFRSSDFAGLRRPRLYGFHTGTGSLSNRKGRGRRSGGREREPRRAGEGR